MQSCTVVVFLALLAAVVAEEYYSDKWSDVDTHAIIDNDRLFPRYENCMRRKMTTGCPQDAVELGRVMEDALKTGCIKCSPAQITKLKDVFGYLCKVRPEALKRILAEVDPDGKYRAEFEKKFGKIDGNC